MAPVTLKHGRGLYSLFALYNLYHDELASKLSKLHRQLDLSVLNAYGWSEVGDLLSQLLDLNLELSDFEEEGLAIVGPWDPNRR